MRIEKCQSLITKVVERVENVNDLRVIQLKPGVGSINKHQQSINISLIAAWIHFYQK